MVKHAPPNQSGLDRLRAKRVKQPMRPVHVAAPESTYIATPEPHTTEVSTIKAQVVQGDLVAQDIYGRWYDARVPVFISLDDPSGLVIDRLVFDGPIGTGTSDYLVTVDSLIELRTQTKHKWGDNEHSYQFPDPSNPPAPGDDLYPFYQWLLANFPGWPDNGGIQPQPGWGGGTPPITSEPINNVAPSLGGGAFIGQTITLDDGSWTINPAEIGRTRRWFFDGSERTQLRNQTSYAPVLADWGARITADVTVENADGSTTEPTSNSMVAGGVDPLEAHPDWELLNDAGISNLYVNGADNYAIRGNSTDARCMVAFTDTNATDIIADFVVLAQASSNTLYPMVLRYVDDDHFIGVQLTSSGARLREFIGGSFVNLTTNLPYTAPANIEVNLLLGNWEFTVDGTTVSGTTNHVERGRIGTVNSSTQVWTDGDVEFAEPWTFTALDEFEVVTAGTINGLGEVGAQLTATDPTFTLPAGVARQWMRGGTPIAGATRNTYTLVEADRALDITCQFKAYNQGRELVSLSNVIRILAPPLALTPPIIEGADTNPGVLLSFVSEGTWDTAGLPETSRAYQWRSNGTPIPGATSNTYSPPTGGNFSATVTIATADGSVAQTSNVLGFAAIIPGTATISGYLAAPATLTCNPGNWQHADTLTYQWQRDGADIAGETATTYDWTIANDNGTDITCVVTGNNIIGPVSVVSNTLTPAALAPVNTMAPAISGYLSGPSTLTCAAGSWTSDPALPITITYQWQRDGVNIVGATSATYDWNVSDDNGKAITCDVTATNAAGPTSLTTNTLTPAALTPVNTGIPSISGSTNVSATMTCSTGAWTSDPLLPITYAYLWHRNGSPISGETSNTYVTSYERDDGAELTCRVTATNAVGSESRVAAGVTVETPNIGLTPDALGDGWAAISGGWSFTVPPGHTFSALRFAHDLEKEYSISFTYAGDVTDVADRFFYRTAGSGSTGDIYMNAPGDYSQNYTPPAGATGGSQPRFAVRQSVDGLGYTEFQNLVIKRIED